MVSQNGMFKRNTINGGRRLMNKLTEFRKMIRAFFKRMLIIMEHDAISLSFIRRGEEATNDSPTPIRPDLLRQGRLSEGCDTGTNQTNAIHFQFN